jgi:hypothetical protein
VKGHNPDPDAGGKIKAKLSNGVKTSKPHKGGKVSPSGKVSRKNGGKC